MHFAAAKKSLLARRVRFSARRPNEIPERQSDRTIARVERSRSVRYSLRLARVDCPWWHGSRLRGRRRKAPQTRRLESPRYGRNEYGADAAADSRSADSRAIG